jgi:Tol biopolymer transport system component
MNPALIGPYQILRELGRGGMGEVYLARDPRLDRQVAIKALPAHLAQDAERLARFQREAKVLASLNHPGIGAIYGLEEANGHQYLVLEFVQGDTLADQLANGPMPVDEALPIARQVAEALELAHEKGVIHRDVKPGNVMVTPEGVVKVLDFGLARTADGSPSSMNTPPAPDSPTVHSPTVAGVILGTAGYMSPEQARGKPVDKRSDIFSFGCVFYEMLTGVGPFPGETVTDSLGAILHREPDWSRLPPNTPNRVRELLRNCLAKDRRNRLQDIGDARLELERAIAGHEWTHTVGGRPARKSPLRSALAVVGAVALLAAGWLVGRALDRPDPVEAPQILHVSATIPATPELSAVVGIAPSSRFVVYLARRKLDGDRMTPSGVLVVRRLDRDEFKVIDGTEGAVQASLSQDGRWLAFIAVRDRARRKISLKKIALDDGRPIGSPETICDLPSAEETNLCWSSEREIVIASSWNRTILAVSASGGEPREVLREEDSKEIDNWGEVRPMVPGKSVLASRWALVGQTFRERTEIVDLATGTRTLLLTNAGGAQRVGNEFIVARRNQTLVAARFDAATSQIVGEPQTVWSGGFPNSFFVSANGTLAMTTFARDTAGRKLVWIDEQGQSTPVAASSRAYAQVAVAPDGSRIAAVLDSIDVAELSSDVWIQDLTRGTFSRLPTLGPVWEMVWTRDGQRIAYGSVSQEEFSIWNRRIEGGGEPVKMYVDASTRNILVPSSWSHDGKILAIMRVDLGTGSSDVLLLEQEPATTNWTAKPYLTSPASEEALIFSPDGSWVRFNSDESGRRELYIQRFTSTEAASQDARSGRLQISTNGSLGSGWCSPDGKEIRFIDHDDQVVSVQIQTEPTLSASIPKVLYSVQDMKTRHRTWAPDGRMLAVLEGENDRGNRIDLVVHFLDDLRSKLRPTK